MEEDNNCYIHKKKLNSDKPGKQACRKTKRKQAFALRYPEFGVRLVYRPETGQTGTFADLRRTFNFVPAKHLPAKPSCFPGPARLT